MSDQESQAKPAGEDSPRRQRYLKWRRRVGRIVITLVLIAVVVRLTMSLLLPFTINKAAGFYGLNCEYSRLKLSLVGGFASIWDMKLTPKTGGDPIVTVANAGGAISTWDLFRGRLTIWRLQADGIDVSVDRTAEGKIPLVERFVQSAQASKQQREAAAAAKGKSELDLGSPLQAEAISVTRVRLHINDALVQPEFKSVVEISLNIDNLGSLDRPSQFDVTVRSKDLLDELRIFGEGRSVGRNVAATVNVKGWGLNPRPLAAYLGPLGLRAVTDKIDMAAQMQVLTKPVAGSPTAMQVHCVLDRLSLLSDAASAASLRKVVIDAPWVAPDRLDLGTITVEGARLVAGRAKDGAIRAGGIEMIAAAAEAATTRPTVATRPVAVVAADREVTTLPTTRPALPMISLDSLTVSDVYLSFRDEAIGGSSQFELSLEQLRLANLATYPRDAKKPAECSVVFAAPGLARHVAVSATVFPFAKEKTGQVNVEVNGIRLDSLKPYLAPLGLEPEFKDGTLRAQVNGDFVQQADGWLRGDVQLQNLTLSDTAELFRWDGAAIKGCRIDPHTFEVKIDAIEMSGPSLTAQRDASGAVRMLGFRTRQPVTTPAQPVAPAATTPAVAAKAPMELPIPRIAVERFTWKDLKLRLTDAAVKPVATMEIGDAGFELTQLDLATRPTTRPARPAGLKAWLRAPGMIDRLDVTGSLTPAMDSASLDLKVDSEGITGAALAPYVQPLGIEPTARNGRLKLQTHADVRLTPDGAQAALSVRDFAFTDGNQELGGIDLFDVGPIHLTDSAVAVERIQVTRPRIAVGRDEQGRLEVAGVRIDPRKVGGKPAAASSAATTASAAAGPASVGVPAVKSMLATLGALRVDDAQLSWSDRMVTPAALVRLHSTVAVDHVTLGKDADPARLSLTAWVEGILKKATVQGTLRTGPTHQSADLAIRGNGLTIGSLAPYLPPTLLCTLQDGRFAVDVSADVTPAAAGGVTAKASVRDAKFSDGERVLAQLGQMAVVAGRIDPKAQIIALDSVRLSGVEVEAHRTASGEFSAFGVLTNSKAPAAPAAPLARSATQPEATGPETDVATLIAAGRAKMPLITLKTLDLTVDQVRFIDDMRPAAAPIVVRDLHVANLAPLAWLGANPAAQPANDIQVTCSIDDLVKQASVHVVASPFADQPSAKITKVVTGIHGDKLASILPETAGLIDGSTLKNATFKAEMDLSMRVERHGPTQFDFRRDFEVYATIRDIEFRDEQGPVLAGVQEINLPVVKVRPGDSSVVIPSLEITRPIFHAWREKDGLHALGLRMIMPTPSTQPAVASASASTPPAVEPVANAPSSAASAPQGELLIRKLTVSGIDVSFEDHSVEPAVLLPLTGLEVEASELSSRAMFEKRPMRFNASLTSGNVMLPTAEHHATGSTERPVFAAVTANGQLTLYPQPTGWVKTSVSGLELVALRGLAREQGVTLTRGTLDMDTDVRLRSAQDADVNTRIVLNDLSISEEDNGPIRRALKLPAPLTTAINLVEDADGSITVPLSVSIRNRGISYAAITGSVIEATGQVLATAIISAPAKLIGGLTGAQKKPTRQSSIDVAFVPGSSTLEPDDLAKLAKALEPYRFDRNAEITIVHELGQSDVSMAAGRANPGEDDAMALVTQLRDRRQRLTERRGDLETRASSELAMYGSFAVRPTLDELRSVCRDLTQTEDALDRVLDLFRPGADRQTDRRTRAAALELAQQRLTAVQAAIADAHVSTLGSRVSKANPRYTPSQNEKEGKVTVKIVSRPR